MLHLSAMQLYERCTTLEPGLHRLEQLPEPLDQFMLTPDLFNPGAEMRHFTQLGWNPKGIDDFGKPLAMIAIWRIINAPGDTMYSCNSLLQYSIEPDSNPSQAGIARKIDMHIGLTAISKIGTPDGGASLLAKCAALQILNLQITNAELDTVTEALSASARV